MKSELLIGCGSSRVKRLGTGEWDNLTTLDINEDHNPDVVYDLEKLPLPFPDNSFDEIHAYEVLEHVGRQGDYRFFFAQWEDFWRILKRRGHFFASVPMFNSPWAWGDPSHTRVLPKECLTFLDQMEYEKQVGITPMTDFRHIYKGNFRLITVNEGTDTMWFILRAQKA